MDIAKPPPRPDLPSVRHARRDRAVWRAAFLASIGFHLSVFLAWRGTTREPSVPSSTRPSWTAPDRSLEAVRLRPATPAEIPPPPMPVLAVADVSLAPPDLSPAIGMPKLRPTRPDAPAAFVFEAKETEGDYGDGYLPPLPRSILPDWRVPRSVRGMEIVARVWVDAGGRPRRTVLLDPPTPDRGFNRRLADRVRRLEYRPAMRNGEPVGGYAAIQFVFCPPTVTATSPPAPRGRGARPCSERRRPGSP